MEEAIKLYGEDEVANWRRSFDARPPPFAADHPYHPAADAKYRRWQARRRMRHSLTPSGPSARSDSEID